MTIFSRMAATPNEKIVDQDREVAESTRIGDFNQVALLTAWSIQAPAAVAPRVWERLPCPRHHDKTSCSIRIADTRATWGLRLRTQAIWGHSIIAVRADRISRPTNLEQIV